MTTLRYVNNASTTLDGVLGSGATTVTVADGSLFVPVLDYITATIDQGNGTIEIVHVTSRAGNVLTISRGEELTTDSAHPDGTTFEARITAGVLDYLDPVKTTSGDIGVGDGASPSSSGDSIAIGQDASVDNIDAIAIGSGASATAATGAIVIGKDAAAATDESIAIGKNADAGSAAQSSIVIGAGSTSASLDNIIIGPSVAVPSGSPNSIVIGGANAGLSTATGSVVAIDAQQVSTNAVVLKGAAISAADSVVLGTNAASHAASGVVLGNAAKNFVERATVLPPFVAQREYGNFYDQYQVIGFTASPTIISSPPCDLGPGIAWSATTIFDGEVFTPVTPNGYQYIFVKGLNASPSTYDGANAGVNSSAEVTEPTWTTGIGDWIDSNTDSDDAFVMVDVASGIDCTVSDLLNGTGQVKFYPTRVIFICQQYATLTAEPYISVGNESSATAYVNNQQLTGITEAHQMQYFDITNPKGADRVIFKLNTAGVGASGQMMGRFLVEGYYMQLPG